MKILVFLACIAIIGSLKFDMVQLFISLKYISEFINDKNISMEENMQTTNKRPKTVPIILGLALLTLSFVAGMFFGDSPKLTKTGDAVLVNQHEKPDYLEKSVDFGLYWEVMELVKEKYIDAADVLDTELFYGSLAGLVASVGDPYTVFLTPTVTEDFTEELSGNFQGIGAEIGLKKNILNIIAPLPDTPAERAGLRARDKILSIDGVTTAGMSLDEAVHRIRGEGGTEVILNVFSLDAEEARDVPIIRDVINIVSVSWDQKDNNTAYIRLSYFNQDTEQQFREIAREILATDPERIILDVRNNPGGFLDVSIGIASYWVDDGIVVQERFSDDSINNYNSRNKPLFAGIPTVVLVNEGSASASEIVAGALRDHDQAILIGKTTFGKGSVQDLTELDDGSSVKITIAKWLTPDGITIDKEGLIPDMEVELTKEDYDEDRDPQLDAAIEYLNK